MTRLTPSLKPVELPALVGKPEPELEARLLERVAEAIRWMESKGIEYIGKPSRQTTEGQR